MEPLAEGAGEAYLFSLTGKLLTTFAISDPAVGSFGAALAASGSSSAASLAATRQAGIER